MEKNMTQGSPWKHILFFSLPILGGMILQLLYTTVDGIVVGNFVGQEALGAMNTSLSYANVLLALATGMSTGCGIVLAQFFGAGRREELRDCVSTMLILMLGLGLVILVVGSITAAPVLKYVLSVPADTYDYAVTYMRIYFLGMVFQFAYNAFAAELRSVGDSRSTMLFLLISSVANILFDLLFVIVFGLGVAGVAIGTVLAQLISAVVSLVYIHKRHELLWVNVRELRFHKDKFQMILNLGIPVTIQALISQLGCLTVQRLINSFGSAVMAGVAAGSKIEGYTMMPIIAFAAGVSTYTGQNAGAGDMKRIRKGIVAAIIICLIFCVCISVPISFFAPALVSIFNCTGEALAFGSSYLRFMVFSLYIMVPLFVFRGMLQGCGDAKICTVITFATLAMRVVSAYFMATIPAIGSKSVYFCMAVDFGIGTLFYLCRFLQGKWKQKVLTAHANMTAQKETAE